MGLKNETKVGLLVVTTLALVLVFAWLMGAANPFKQSIRFQLTYNFAGGIEVGSPVRVAGIKVGKVEKIQLFAKTDDVLTPVKLTISVSKEAAEGVRTDSKFFINLAGIIGERYVEITPGTVNAALVQEGQVLRGIDPPRIDQLISQSFDLAGKIKEVIEENEGDFTQTIRILSQLSANINKTFGQLERSNFLKTDVSKLVNNLIEITTDVRVLTAKTRSPEGQKTLELLNRLLWKLEPLDKESITKFFQKEGIKTKLF